MIADVPCRKCGYNLRGLRLDGRCPECGRAVGLSVQGDLLRFSDPGWLRNRFGEAANVAEQTWARIDPFAVAAVG